MGEGLFYPRQVVLLTSSYRGRSNLSCLDAILPVGDGPDFVVFTLTKNSFTLELIERSKEFVIAIVDARFKDAVRLAGSVSGNVVDKVLEAGIVTERGAYVSAPYIVGALANIECRAVGSFECGERAIIVGEVLKINKEASEGRENSKSLFIDVDGSLFEVG
ncbi:MAG: flavin reductase family protein [Candidatus Anstonellales archaeon]